MTKVKHVLGISGGKDSAALAIYLHEKYPNLDMEYYTCDTGKELDETYELIDKLESLLGKKILKLQAAEGTPEASPFDHFLSVYGGYLPSTLSRWCTKRLKLEPFEKYIASSGPIISYVGIRGDEDREGYISKKSNIQSIFPFRKNIWSEDVVRKVLNNKNIPFLLESYQQQMEGSGKLERVLEIVKEPLSPHFSQGNKLEILLDLGVKEFNQVAFQYLQGTDYPLAKVDEFPLLDNEDVLVIDDIFRTLRESGVGVPAYYEKREYYVEIDGEQKTGYYSRSRSGCFFCFFQQKIEWVWLYENHPNLFQQAIQYEKEGYTWNQGETLDELVQLDRRQQIKREHYIRTQRKKAKAKSPYLLDILAEADGEGCAACFI
ncbi:MAG: phosphoadenosine phosphosulfate reductase family protein [Bacteroidota bacterium]